MFADEGVGFGGALGAHPGISLSDRLPGGDEHG